MVSIHSRIGWQGLKQSEQLDVGEIYLITGTDFENGLINFKTSKYISEFRYNQDNNIQLQNDDILVTKDGTLGKVAIIRHLNKRATLNSGIYRIRIKDLTKVYPAYLYQYLSAPFLLNFANKTSIGGTIKHLNQSQIINFPIPLSSLEEQQKISKFLSFLDFKINVIKNKISTLKKYRKGLLKIVCEQGHVCLLDEVLSEEIHKTKVNNEYPIISSTREGVFLQKDYFNHQVASDNNVGYKIIRRNQIVFSPQNLWLGNINLNDKYDVGCVSPSYKIYSFDTELIDPQFFIEYLKTPYMFYQYKLCSDQGASVVRRNLDLSSFLDIKITLPDLETQKIIGALKTHLDLLDRQLFLLKKVKSFLFQNMFI